MYRRSFSFPSSQPPPRTHVPAGTVAARARTLAITSSMLRASPRSSESADSEKWTCVSIRPGVAVRPARSTTFVCSLACFRAPAVVPTKTIRPSVMATASAIESRASTVIIVPFTRMRSAEAVCCTARRMPRSGTDRRTMRQRGMRQILTQTRLRTYVTLRAGRCLSPSRVAVDRRDDIVIRAREGSLEAYGLLVERTQKAAYAAALGVLRNPSLAEDATQDAFIRAFRRLGDLDEPAAFDGWLRRIVITVALNTRRRQRCAFLRLDDVPDVPVLDETETVWTALQRQRLAGALLTLTAEDRRLCARRYHGGWTTARLAPDAGIDEAAMRKRLQRVRDQLRKE